MMSGMSPTKRSSIFWLILCVVVGIAGSGWAAPSDRSFFKKRKAPVAKPSVTTSTKKIYSGPVVPLAQIDQLTLPLKHGSIKETFDAGQNRPIIVHIQDAHANYVAQKHLSSLLEYLILKHELSLVLVEGGSRNDSLSYMRSYAPLEKRLQVADEFLKAGKISGENYLDLTTDYEFTVYGIEKPELYDANMAAFLKVEQAQPVAKKGIANYRTAVERLKERIYPEPVKELEREEAQVAENQVPLTTHYEHLAEVATTQQIALPTYPNFQQFLRVSQLEKKINFKQVETERGKVLRELSKVLPKDEMEDFLKRSRQVKRGTATASSFYRALYAKLSEEQKSKYEELSAYCRYLASYDEIEHSKLFSEVEHLADTVKHSYFSKKDQKTLAQIAKDVAILGDLVELKLIPEKHEYYVAHRRAFDPARWGKQLTALGKKAQVTIPEFDPGVLKAAVPPVEEFYDVARQRDLAMVENALKQIKAFEVDLAVLISGGFHTPVIADLLKKHKISFAVVAPKVPPVTEADIELYHKVLKETYVPMAPQHQTDEGQ